MKVNPVIGILVIALAAAMLLGIEAEKYRVGGDLGWTIPPRGTATYATWASKYTFEVKKDLLEFIFQAGENDVIIVTKENFDICNTTKPLFQYRSSVALAVANSGTYYFTCSFAGHCVKGQKVAISFAPLQTCCQVQVQVQAPIQVLLMNLRRQILSKYDDMKMPVFHITDYSDNIHLLLP